MKRILVHQLYLSNIIYHLSSVRIIAITGFYIRSINNVSDKRQVLSDNRVLIVLTFLVATFFLLMNYLAKIHTMIPGVPEEASPKIRILFTKINVMDLRLGILSEYLNASAYYI